MKVTTAPYVNFRAHFASFKKMNGKAKLNQTKKPGRTRNKLRTYRLFKNYYTTENYVIEVLNRQHRSTLAKFRCGVAPLRIETGRYERLTLEQRVCFN